MALKMYILIKDKIDLGHAILASAHASLAGYLEFQNDPETIEWLKSSFRKVVCKVTDKEFEKAKEYADYRVMTESAFGDNFEVAIVFRPREEWPKFFKFLKLYKDYVVDTGATPDGTGF
jgi:hypothetical protein